MDPRKKTADELKGAPLSFLKPDELKGPPLSFISAHQGFPTDDLEDGQTASLRLSDTESPHSSGLRLTALEGLHTVAGMRLPVSQSMLHGLQLSVSDADTMHSAGIRLTDAETAHAAAMRLNDDNDPLHNSTLHLSEAELPHPGGGGLRLPLSTADYGLSNMYSMSSILSGTPEARPMDVSNKRDPYDIGLSRPQSMRFGIYEKDGRLPGISYMMSTQDSSMRAAGLDMTIPSLPVISSSATLDNNPTPLSLITSHASFTSTVASNPQTLFSGRGYGIPENESDSDSELADAAAIHSNLAEAQERFASHLGRMDMKSIIEATKLAVAQQQLSHLPVGPLDMKQQDAKDLERHLIMRDAEMNALSSSLSPADHMAPVDVTSLTSHHATLADMSPLTDGHVTDLTTTGQLTDGHITDLTVTNLSGHPSTDSDSQPSSPEKGDQLMFDRRPLPAHWFHEFPWLLMDSSLNLYYCRYCMQTTSNSALAKGCATLRPRKGYFVKHEQTEEHHNASTKFLGVDTEGPVEPQEVVASASQTMTLDSMPLTWSTTPTVSSKLEELQPVSSDFTTLPTTTASQLSAVNTGPDPAQKPMIIDSTNAHVLNLVSSPRTLAETRAQFEGWFDDFLWLVYDAQLNVFICKVCQQAGLPSLLAAGKAPDQLQRAPFEEHQGASLHLEAARTLQDKNPEDSSKDVESETEDDETQTFRIRRIRPAWFVEFPWLELNQTDMCFYCKQCRLYKQQGIFSYGRPAGNPRKDNFLRHENTEGHKIAVLQDAGISGEEAVRTVLAMQEMINNENSDVEKGREVGVDQLGLSEQNGVKELHSGEVAENKAVMCTGGKTGLGRKIKLQWFIEFPWLELDENKNIVYCKLCRIYHPIGIYVSGKSAANLKRADLQKHEATEGHKIAVNSHSRAGAEGEQRLESHSLDPSNVHLIDITTVSQITHAQNKSTQNITLSLPEILESDEEDPTIRLSRLPVIMPTPATPPIVTTSAVTTVTPASDDWATQFPWYTVESPSQTAFCTVCRAECLTNALAQGVPVYVVMKKDCIVHESIEEHQRAMENARRAAVKRELEAKEAEEVAARQKAQSLPPPKRLKTSSPYVTKQVPLPADALADPKTPWKSLFWHHANQMRHLGILCDVTISVGSHSNRRCYHVHKLLLICSSELFKMYLRDSTVETHYHFDNISPVGLEGVLQYIYGQPLKGMTCAQSAECCAAADVLMMPKAKELFQKVGVTAAASALKSKKKSAVLEVSTVLPVPLPLPPQMQVLQPSEVQQQPQSQQLHHPQPSPPPPPVPPTIPPPPPPTLPKHLPQQTHTHHQPQLEHPPQQQEQQQQLELLELKPPASPECEDLPLPIHGAVITEPNFAQLCGTTTEATNVATISETDCSSLGNGDLGSSLKDEDNRGGGLLDQSVTNKTVGQLAKKPSIIGQMRPKDRIKTYASLRSIQTRARNKTKVQSDVSIGTVTRSSAREVKVNGVKSPPPGLSDMTKIEEKSPQQELQPPPQQKSEKVKKVKAKKRLKAERSSSIEKISKKRHKVKEKDLGEAERINIPLELAAECSESEVGQWNPEDGDTKELGVGKQAVSIALDRKPAKDLPACKQCGKQFLRPAFLARHIASKHKSGVSSSVTLTSTYKCETCGKGFPNRYDLKVHARRHTGERPYLCNVCGKSFTRRETLIEHSYIHKPDSEKPHRCEECGKGFYKIYDLQRHFVGIHSGARPFACHQCGKTFPWARSLSDHLLSHKGAARVRPYKCEECDMNFRRKYDLERHKVKHAAQKPFECEWCGHGFTQKGSMDKHKREFCHGRPGASEQSARVVRPNQNCKPSVKLEAEAKLEGSALVPDVGIPAILTLTTGQRTPTTDLFPAFPPVTESNPTTMLYYSI